jgi:K+-sensing histidine kinase KdpD
MKELSLNILDIVQNSIRAEADEISILVNESPSRDIYQIIIRDNGKGIPNDILRHVTDPFVTTRTKRRMGLGLSLLKYHAELTGGGLEINSVVGKGTEVKVNFSFSHIDRQPLGDIVGILVILMASNQGINFIYTHKTENGEYRFSSKETKEFLELEALNERNLLEEIGWMIGENLKEIRVAGFELRERNKVIL